MASMRLTKTSYEKAAELASAITDMIEACGVDTRKAWSNTEQLRVIESRDISYEAVMHHAAIVS